MIVVMLSLMTTLMIILVIQIMIENVTHLSL
jgi:hypothetical protein